MADAPGTHMFEWLQANLRGTSDVAKAGPVLKADFSERYGSASTHLALVLHDQLDVPQEMAAMRSFVNDVTAQPTTAVKAFKRLVKHVPAFTDAKLFAPPGGLHDVPQILATAYFGRTAGPGFKAGEGSAHYTFLGRMQWLLLKVQEAAARGELDQFGAVLDAAASKGFELEPRILQRVQNVGRDLMPTPAGVIAAVGAGVATSMAPTAFPLDNTPFLHYVRGVDAAFWESGRSFVPPGQTTQALYLVHMRHFLVDASDRLALSVLPCDRAPIVAPWYAAIVIGARAYATTLAHVLTESTEAPIRSTVDFTTFSLMAMAAGANDSVPPPVDALFNGKSKSMYVKSDGQDGPSWALLRTTLSGVPIEDAHEVARRFVNIPEQLDETRRAALMLCVLMHTQTGMAIVGHSVADKGIDRYPLAKHLVSAADPIRGQNALDVIMATYSGTYDLERLASDDLAFTDIPRYQAAWTRELMLRVPDGIVQPFHHDESQTVARNEIATGFCQALRAVGMQWIQDITDGKSSAFLVEARRTLERVGTSQAAMHCSAWLAVAFDFSKALERHMQDVEKEPALIKSPIDYESARAIGSRISAREDEAYLRMHFRMQTEHALHNARRGGLWKPGKQLVLAAWVATAPDSGDDVRIFARAITEHSIPQEAWLLKPGWRESIERRGDDSIIDCALEFERALHACNVALAKRGGSAPVSLPLLPRNSAYRTRAQAVATGANRFDANRVRSFDPQTDIALHRFRQLTANLRAHDSLLITGTPFHHGCSVAVVAIPSEADDLVRGSDARVGKLVEQRWPNRSALLQRLASFDKGQG